MAIATFWPRICSVFACFTLLNACGTTVAPASDADTADAAASDTADANGCPAAGAVGIGHVVIIVQENHTFDSYYGAWCKAPAGSNPACTTGTACCEAAPAADPSGATPTLLDDAANANFSPNHHQKCELQEMIGGKMDRFTKGTDCSDPRNFAVASAAAVQPYWDLAAQNAIADRYFQPIAGESSANDMYLAVAKEVFIDNAYSPEAVGSHCAVETIGAPLPGQTTVADLLRAAGHSVAWYAEGYAKMAASPTACPDAPADCPMQLPIYPCVFDPGDVPFLYYTQFADGLMRDTQQLSQDLANGALPDVAYVKALGYKSEHPGAQTTISAGMNFVTATIQAVEASCYKDNTLILLTWDEGGGYFDHIAPPPDSAADQQPYGTRVPLLAIGRFAKKGAVSHVQMEHSSLVKFLEWNFLAGKTGQLGARDVEVNNIGSLLDPVAVGAVVP
jgi:phospholipase C